MLGIGWLKKKIKILIVEVLKGTDVEVEMVNGKPVYKVKFKKEI